ncbi:purine-binding chemotaxis protein CheW [Azospirillum sp. OGB3]|uniref:chemotaxis protein CheW n=1 Tax=Azospirillum sp. OGB3 TaxID=2587012 RepID=UPI001605D62D|nr:chemotaxis protein CheW [Azospirillum sp. OGB3]MBB3264842.1 purine-binding chemotaxis protein CheW [Azospirillum sp. OGB3]
MAAIIRRDGVRSFVLFTVGGMELALPLDGVLEILRPPVLVPIPLGPPSLEGLARRRGAVLPVIGLRRVLGLAGDGEGETDDGGADDGGTKAARLLILRHNGQPVGLLVDRVAGLAAVGEDRIADAGTAPDPSIDAGLLAGAILTGDGREGALILDPGPLIERQFADLGRGSAGIADFSGAPQPKTAEAIRQDEEQLVVLTVAEQEFALPVAAVREVVPIPETVTRVPRARAHLLGMMTLRDALLPLVGLRELFGLDARKGMDRGKVAVLRTAEGLVGVAVEDVREILRVPRERIDPVPPLMAREAEFEDMDGIARLNGGARLIPVLSAERLFRHGAGDGAGAAAGFGGGVQGREGEGTVATDADVERAEAFVVFRLASAEYGLPVGAVQEVLRRPDAVTPLPNAPDFVSGVTTLRGAVLPLVALRRLLRLPEGRENGGDRGRVVVIAAGAARAGLLVDGMAGIVRIPDGAIGPAPVVSQAQHRLIRRIGALENAGERRMILLMDPAELLDMDQLADLLATV